MKKSRVYSVEIVRETGEETFTFRCLPNARDVPADISRAHEDALSQLASIMGFEIITKPDIAAAR